MSLPLFILKDPEGSILFHVIAQLCPIALHLKCIFAFMESLITAVSPKVIFPSLALEEEHFGTIKR